MSIDGESVNLSKPLLVQVDLFFATKVHIAPSLHGSSCLAQLAVSQCTEKLVR